jgi:hypothetical protein
VPEAPRVVATRECPWFTAVLRDDGILAYHPKPGLILTLEIASQVLQVGLQIVDGPKPTLVLMQEVQRVDRHARAFFASEEYLRLSCQTALVVGSPVSRVIGNFFVGLNRLKYPCRIFDDPQLAVAWLRGFVS